MSLHNMCGGMDVVLSIGWLRNGSTIGTDIKKTMNELETPNHTLYRYHRTIADQLTDIANTSPCVRRWYKAADKWDLVLQYSHYTPFQKKLEEAYFIALFKRWLARHPRIHQRLLAKKS